MGQAETKSVWPFYFGMCCMKNNLRVIRAKNRVAQFQLRLMTGIHQSKLSLAENDLIELADQEKKKLAKALGVSVKDIWQEGG